MIDLPTSNHKEPTKAIKAKSISFRNLTYKSGTNDYCGIQHSTSVKFTDCIITGKSFLYADTVTFDNCTFKQENADYNVWTYGAQNVTFNNCTFECKGKAVLIYNEGNGDGKEHIVTFNKCKFNAGSKADGKAAIEVDSALLKDGMNFTVNINGCTHTGFDNGSVSGNPLWNEKEHKNEPLFGLRLVGLSYRQPEVARA